MTGVVELLIVSSRLENKRALLRILDGLPMNVYTADGAEQAEEALERHRIDVVLCDERIADGTYHDVLGMTSERRPKIEFIMLLTTGGAGEYQEAMQLGVTDVVRCPLQPTDVELALIHATRSQARVAHAVA